MQNRSGITKHFDFMVIDILSMTVSFLIAYLIKLDDGISEFRMIYRMVLMIMLGIMLFHVLLFSPYKDILRRDLFSEIKCSLFFVFINILSVTTFLYLFKIGSQYSRLHLAYTNIIYFIISIVLRTVWKKHLLDEKKFNKIGVFVISDSDNIDSVLFNIENSEFSEYLVEGIYLNDVDKTDDIRGYKTYTKKDKLYDKVSESNALEVFAYCSPNKIRKDAVEKIVNDGIQFHICMDKIFGFEPDNEDISNVAMYRTLNLNVFSFSAVQRLYDPLKRILDILISLLACLFLLPIFLIIKLSYVLSGDKESIIYSHKRVGKNGKEFRLYKFRSMVPDADEILKELLKDEKYRQEWEKDHKFDDDPRITKVGNFIRKTSIDEFPQFINVLKGDMAIIGPRPLVPGELKAMNGLGLYEKVKPGITGWWACNGRSSISYE